MSRRRTIEMYFEGLDDGTELLLVKLIARAEEHGSLDADMLRRMLTKLVEAHRR